MLNYLDFETSSDGKGITTYDTMAHIQARHWPALHAQVDQVLAWCHSEFAAPGPLEHGHLWDLDVQLQSDTGHLLDTAWHAEQRTLKAPQALHAHAVQLCVTISGGESFAQAFEAQFLAAIR